MGQDVVGATSFAMQRETGTARLLGTRSDVKSVRSGHPHLSLVACAVGLAVTAAGCRITEPNAPPLLALRGGSPTRAIGKLQPPTPDTPGPIVRAQSPQTSASPPPAYPATTLPPPGYPNQSTAGGGGSYRTPMQATDASQFNRYSQPPIPGLPGQQQVGQGAVGSLSAPTISGSFQTSPPPTTVYQPQVPGSATYNSIQSNSTQTNSTPYGAPPYNGLGSSPAYQPASPSDYGAAIAPGATQGLGTGDAVIAPGVLPYGESGLGIDPTLGINAPGVVAPGMEGYRPRQRIAPIDVYVQEARTGRIIVGGSVNSDLGVAGQIVVDERNFNIARIPRSWDDLWSGRAFRGGGQNFRMELMPGSQVERYTVAWTERNLLGYLPYSLSVGGFYYTRQFRDWTEQRLGGRVALGYEVTKDLAISGELRMEDVKIFNPRISGVPDLDSALGSNDIYTARLRVSHDTRDSPFLATRGGLLEMTFDQVFGEYDFSRGNINYSRYFLVRERPDGTGRHTIATTFRFGVTGSQTPIFENYYAGGYSTLRGFSFRGASPVVSGVQVGGEMQMLGSVEYMLPITADEMLRGVAFVDYGTVEQNIEVTSENFRVAPGLGLRISVPALGPAPLAFDFAYPLNYADTDDRQVLSFFMGFTR